MGALFLCFFALVQSLRFAGRGAVGGCCFVGKRPGLSCSLCTCSFPAEHHMSAPPDSLSTSSPTPHAAPAALRMLCRLFVHLSFFFKAVAHCRARARTCEEEDLASLYEETLRISARAQGFFSVSQGAGLSPEGVWGGAGL